MKKLTKTAALILSTLMLFGCTDNSTQSGVGDTTPPSESSVTGSKNESKVESSATENSSTPDNSNDKSDENLVENIDGYQTFSYDKNKYVKTTFRRIYNLKRDGLGAFTGETVTLPLARYAVQDEVLVIKCKVAGDSYVFQNGRSGIKTVQDSSDDNVLNGVYTPIVIEEVIDKTADAVSDLKAGDVIYIEEGFHVCEFIDENGNGKLPRIIFEECGFNIDIIGMQRVKSSASRWRTAFKNGGAIKLTDTRKYNTGRPIEKDLSIEEKYKKLEAKMKLLQVENELLKKLDMIERRVLKKK